MMQLLMLIAQAPTSGPAGQSPPDSFFRFMLPLILAMGVFYIFLFRGQRKDKRRYADMLANLKRNDRVQTIGGILGTVVDVRDNEVVLKVDETSNTKMRFSRGAIKEVLESPGT